MVTLAKFTPSLLAEETLEELFVNRERLLDGAVACIRRAATTLERSHKLFVGPRGAGKTHLVSLVYYRARKLDGFGERFRLAWLPEDPWTITSLDDLLEAIDAHIEGAQGPVVVLVENLDQVMEAIGRAGQQRLRAIMENERSMVLIATATRLTGHLLSEAEPFYGFFDTALLRPFDVEEAAAMLRAIAAVKGDAGMLGRLHEPRVRARLAAIEHLAGGQPRVWALLAKGVSIDGLDDLVSTLMEGFDDLTPYYQEQLARLSPHGRKVVKTLAGRDRAMTVQALAAATRIEERSLGKTVTDLRRRGWIRPRTGLLADMADRRLTFYELAEPLARLAFQLKASRGQPIRLLVDFLVLWFDAEELAFRGGPYPHAAMSALRDDPVLRILHHEVSGSEGRPPIDDELQRALLVLDDAVASFQDGDPLPLLAQPAAVSHLVEHYLEREGALLLRLRLARLAPWADESAAREWARRLEAIVSGAPGPAYLVALLTLTAALGYASDRDRAALVGRQALAVLGEVGEAEPVGSLIGLVNDIGSAGGPKLALDLLEKLRHRCPDALRVRFTAARAFALWRLDRYDEARRDWEDAVDQLTIALGVDDPMTVKARVNLAYSPYWPGRPDDAVEGRRQATAAAERALDPASPFMRQFRAVLSVGDPESLDVGWVCDGD